jgi:DNA processing protein
VLYYRGELSALERPCISIVGTRKCTDYGKRVANKLGERLAEMDIPVISGMARGIDSAAHRGALKTGVTYAILGSGLDVVYPPENKGLMAKISRQGGVLTSYSPGTEPSRGNFPARNRIISGLSLGTVVIEAPEKSGALITANMALDQGREVFAIPGDITKEQSVGTNQLIKTGAKLVQRLDDILNELPLKSVISRTTEGQIMGENNKNKEILSSLSTEAKRTYEILSNTPKKFETLLTELELSSSRLNSILLELEVRGLIKQLAGRRFKLKT